MEYIDISATGIAGGTDILIYYAGFSAIWELFTVLMASCTFSSATLEYIEQVCLGEVAYVPKREISTLYLRGIFEQSCGLWYTLLK